MYAIVEIAGQQFKVEKEQEIFVHRLAGDEGASVEFDNVLLLDNAGKVTVGTPTVDGVMIKAKIIEHLKGDKVIVFHKKRRKGYQKENGHRQSFSKVMIEDILTGVKKAAKKEEPKADAKPAAKAKTETAKATATKAKTTATKKAAPKTAAKKEETAKKKPAAPKAAKKTAAPKATKKAAPKAKKTEGTDKDAKKEE